MESFKFEVLSLVMYTLSSFDNLIKTIFQFIIGLFRLCNSQLMTNIARFIKKRYVTIIITIFYSYKKKQLFIIYKMYC
jgi:hypothetical protein